MRLHHRQFGGHGTGSIGRVPERALQAQVAQAADNRVSVMSADNEQLRDENAKLRNDVRESQRVQKSQAKQLKKRIPS